jgi:hypothetical protein
MPDKPQPPRKRATEQELDALADVSPQDTDDAVAQWKADGGDDGFAELLSAQPDHDRERS